MILNTAGVARILGHGGIPEAVPDEEIEGIRILIGSGKPLTPCPVLREGNPIVVKSGPLKGARGILVGVKSMRRIIVSITLLSQAVAAEVDASDIEAAEPVGQPSNREQDRCILT